MSGEKSLEAWGFVRKVLNDLTAQITADARDERELLEGLRVLNRVTALCTELSVDVDPDYPHFVDMSTPIRLVGGPNPHGSYPLAMISGDRAYRVTGTRGTSAYLGLQVLAGTRMNPRRMSNYLAGAQWIEIPDDATSIVVRDYVGDPTTEIPAQLDISLIGEAPPPGPLTDEVLAAQLTATGWTIVKLTTLHRTVRPDLLGGRSAVPGAAARDLRDRPAHRRNPGTAGDDRAADARLHEVPPDERARQAGMRADHRRHLLQHDLSHPVPPAE
ncbi:hypothetical protein MSAR_02080 [Mycolicibacterium sarraceniae]|uniref:Uncharacterized protein n=1 Tax=Mycolicibacterium sarraceniae TaxID=1534348 RepID=A0A7I7SJF9_9MYCO|nr:hypothetical protein MSAR_02080 [Mycolicibacterium sarraceniae]